MRGSNLTCGHCGHGPIPWGAGVCRGCHAEVHYGTPKSLLWIVFGVSFVAAYLLLRVAHFGLGVQSHKALWMVFGVSIVSLMIFGFATCRRLFRNRAVFYRPYRTR